MRGWEESVLSFYWHKIIKHFRPQAEKLKGQIYCCQLTRVEIPVTKRAEFREKFPFEVHFSSKGSPWILSAASEVVHEYIRVHSY